MEIDTIIDLNKEYLQYIGKICLMDTNGKFISKEILELINCVLEFRQI